MPYIYQNKNIINKLDENNIPYFLVAGSLLGACRNNNIIPYDNDIDIGIMDDQIQKLKKIDIIFNTKGRFISTTLNTPSIDIFVFKKFKDKIQYKYNGYRGSWPNEYFYSNELYPIKQISFGNLSVKIPNNPYKYLFRAFGNNCITEKKIKFAKIHSDDPNLPITIKDYNKICMAQKYKQISLPYIYNYSKYNVEVPLSISIIAVLMKLRS
uniref:LicD/FKTN/FKRP nucleotidyltransferase domain-containing protein n=1 Tax=viral metagenome TaxID=1070528 RepID=A0A6C0EHL6_9ZZZZ